MQHNASRTTSTAPAVKGRAAPVSFPLEAHVGRTLAEVERDLVLATMTRCAGNRTWAADMLGIPAADLRERLIEYRGLEEDRTRDMARREAEAHAADTDVAPTYIPVSAYIA